jgi:hypothetical protein
MAYTKWQDAVVIMCEDVRVISLEPRIATSRYFVEVYEDLQASNSGDMLTRIKCSTPEAQENIYEALIDGEVDWETFANASYPVVCPNCKLVFMTAESLE